MVEEKEKRDKIQVKSDEVQDILGQVPGWIPRRGAIIIAVFVLLILLFTFVFRYPDTRVAEIVITTEISPAPIVARASGKLERLFTAEKDTVQPGTTLGVIENPASFESVQKLKSRISQTDRGMILSPDSFLIRDLGEIQSAYAAYVKAFRDLGNFIQLDYHSRKIESLSSEINQYKEYLNTVKQQLSILEQDYGIARNQFERDSLLFAREVIPRANFDQSRAELLQKQLVVEDARVKISTTKIEISKLEQKILDMSLQRQDESKKLENAMQEAYDKLRGEISIWEKKYLLISPVEGVVTFNRFWSPNQNVSLGDKVMTLIPLHPGEIIGKVKLPQEGAGKVEVGQTVNIRLSDYPHMEFGMLRGIIRGISLVAEENAYSVEVTLPDGLVTYYDKEIEFTQELSGRAEILTDKRKLIERIVDPIRSVISEQQNL